MLHFNYFIRKIRIYTYLLDIRVNTCYNVIMIRKGDTKDAYETSQEMIKLLLKNGFAIISQNGSHVTIAKT